MRNLFDVSGKVALVTGGSRGIGLMIARGFVENGVKVYVCARKQEPVDAAVAELSKLGACEGFAADLTSEDDVKRLAGEISKRESKLHVLVNNAGASRSASTRVR
jgi:NAD(P)-dependent dehydrogenase (short-subunit alcohol dehydrogenase family)